MLSLGQEIRRLRDALGLTQDQVAKAVGHAKPGKVSLWENDERRPSKVNQARLADVLGVTVEHLRQFGKPYDPTEPRRTRRQRAERPDEPFPLRGAVAPVWTERQRGLIEEVAKATAPPGQYKLFLSHAMQGDPPEPMRRYFDELITEGNEMLRLVGPSGMGLIWRLVAILDRHRGHRDAIIIDIDKVLTKVDATYAAKS